MAAWPDLLTEAAALVAVPSVSHCEHELAGHIEQRLRRLPWLSVDRIGSNVIARSSLGAPSRIVLAGHLDTVPANDNAEPRVAGEVLWGLGSADMKGGLAVMLALAEGLERPAVDLTYVFYSGEEVAREHNGLLEIASAAPHLLEGDAAVLGEPTSSHIEAGCQGVLRVEVVLTGARAHTARPWMGVNAIHRMAPLLERLGSYESREPVIDGCRYREAVQAVHVSGGVAGNVVPDRGLLSINHRFAPDRDGSAAEAWLREWLRPVVDEAAGDRISVVDFSPAAAPALDQPHLSALLKASGHPPRAKLGWTDVAFFAERGMPAVNFGPGDPELAHTPDERVTREELDRAFSTLMTVLSGPGI